MKMKFILLQILTIRPLARRSTLRHFKLLPLVVFHLPSLCHRDVAINAFKMPPGAFVGCLCCAYMADDVRLREPPRDAIAALCVAAAFSSIEGNKRGSCHANNYATSPAPCRRRSRAHGRMHYSCDKHTLCKRPHISASDSICIQVASWRVPARKLNYGTTPGERSPR